MKFKWADTKLLAGKNKYIDNSYCEVNVPIGDSEVIELGVNINYSDKYTSLTITAPDYTIWTANYSKVFPLKKCQKFLEKKISHFIKTEIK